MQNVLIVGGSGKQAAGIHLPSVFSDERPDIKLTAIADVRDPFGDAYSSVHGPSMTAAGTVWVALGDDMDANVSILDEHLAHRPTDILIISCPPLFHYRYMRWGLRHGLDIICDKPLIARPGQSGDQSAPVLLLQDFSELCQALEHSRHRNDPHRRCRVYVPLMRRATSPYTGVSDGLREVYELTGQHLTHMLVCRSDGCFRFGDEFDRPGAHGFRAGVGTLTHSGYHYLDFMAWCLKQAPPPSTSVEARTINLTTVGDVRYSPQAEAFGRVLGVVPEQSDQGAFAGDMAELDFDVSYKFRSRSVDDCRLQLSFVQRGCTRRVTPRYPIDLTHDEGLTNDTIMTIHQGALQSFHLLVAQDPAHDGRATLVRRLNPRMAEALGQPVLTVSDVPLASNANTAKNRVLVGQLLDLIADRREAESLASLDVREQLATMKLYALALAAQRHPCSSTWDDGWVPELESEVGR